MPEYLAPGVYIEETSFRVPETEASDRFEFAETSAADGGDEDGTIVWELGEGAYTATRDPEGLDRSDPVYEPEEPGSALVDQVAVDDLLL